jgi:tyrosine aminotransferase
VSLNYDKWTDITNTFEFAQKLVDEENVLCLPGECFFKAGFVRIGMSLLDADIVISHPADVIHDACERIVNFCNRHAK